MDSSQTNTHFDSIRSKNLLIRRFKPGDFTTLRAYRLDPEVAKYQYWTGCSEEEAKEFTRWQSTQAPDIAGEWLQLAVESLDNQEHIGDVAFQTWENPTDTVYIGSSFSRKAQGKGFATEALSYLLRYLFEDLSKRRVVGISDARNGASIRLLERLGFRREGHFVENTYFKGSFCDEYSYALLKREWPKTRAYKISNQRQ